MHEPPSEGCEGSRADRALVSAALSGDGGALDALVRRHQTFVHAVCVRMLWDPRDAEDATQEILVKIVTGLASYRGDSAFRTWAYRIAANHVLNWRRGRAERMVGGFEDFGRLIDELADRDLAGEASTDAESRLLADETRVACLTGMLLCLDRDQRVAFVLGEVFEVSDSVGGEVLGITRANFRQRLARSRQQLYEFMRGKCGLADPANPCRCARKTRSAIRAGIVDPRSLRFVASHVVRVERAARERSRSLHRQSAAACACLFRGHGARNPPDLVGRVRALLADGRFRAALDLDGDPR